MYGKHIKWFTSALVLASLIGCRQAETVSPTETDAAREPASLVLTTDISALITPSGTRTIDADDNTIRHVSLFLIDYLEDRLVAYRNIYPDTQAALNRYNDIDLENGFVDETTGQIDPDLTSGKAIRVTFDFNSPKHGSAERLTRGTYVLLAVANFSESDQFGQTGIAAQIQSLIEDFRQNSDVGLGNFKANYAHFYDLTLKIPDETQNGASYAPYVRPGNVSIPLSTTQYLHLISGQNRSSAELKHTCARVRVDVCNYSDQPLTINSLQMSNNFTQSNCYLFSRLDHTENYAIENDYRGKGAPVTTSSNALIPFQAARQLTREMGATTIFDGLIYESRDEANNYTYTIDVSYGQKDLKRYVLKNNGQPISSWTDLQNEGPYFLLKRSDGNSYLYTENDKVYASSGDNTPQQILDLCAAQNYSYSYVWNLEWAGNGSSYYLRNVYTGDYIDKISYSYGSSEWYRLGMVDNSGLNNSYTANLRSGRFLFVSDYYRDRYSVNAYINIRADQANMPVVGWEGDGEWSQFALYPVEEVSGLGTREEVVLRTIDKTSGEVNDVHEIQRNDFIRVLVEVSYNPDKGDFEFIVNDWQTGGGDITFN